jgi:hypothetical protein
MLWEIAWEMRTMGWLIYYSPFAGLVRHMHAHAAHPCDAMGAHACQQQGITRLASLGQKAMVVQFCEYQVGH